MGDKIIIESGDYYLNIELDNKDSKTVAEIEDKIKEFKLISKFFNKENKITSYVIAIDKESSKDLLNHLEKFKSEIINYNLSIQNDGE